MKIAIASDHAGFALKTTLAAWLRANGHDVTDHGPQNETSVDYPDFAKAVAHDVASGNANYGVLVCSSGIGISIAANKVHGIRAALCHCEDAALYCRLHNDANILCFGQKYTTPYIAERCLDIFLKTQFEAGRHARRVEKIEN